MKIKLWLISNLLFVLCLLLFLRVVPVSGANVSITGGTNGTACDSGGYFTPSSVTINSGDTVTISVPADDPYTGGLEIHGFPQGSFTVARGGSMTTNTITADVSYYGTWPSSGCMKGSGTITVTAPVQPPPSNPGPTPTPTPSSSSSSSTPNTNTPPPAVKTTPTTPTATKPTPNTSVSPPMTVQPKVTNPPKTNAMPKTKFTPPSRKSPGLKTVAIVGSSSLVFVVATFIIWRRIIRRRLPNSKTQSPTDQSPDPPPPQYRNGPPNEG